MMPFLVERKDGTKEWGDGMGSFFPTFEEAANSANKRALPKPAVDEKEKEEKEKYRLPSEPSGAHGFYKTGNIINGCVGLLLTADGKLWEMPHNATKAMKESGVEPDVTIHHGSKDLPVWHVDEGGESYVAKPSHQTAAYSSGTSVYHVNDCVYTAAKGFLEMMGLGSLTSGDRNWFKWHPKITTDGVTRSHVLSVVHGLVSAYPGLGIDRVYMPRLSSLGEEHAMFAKAIGMNPSAYADHATSNDEFVEAMGEKLSEENAEHIHKVCRFEFVDTPPLPAIVMLNSKSHVLSKGKGTTKKAGKGKKKGGTQAAKPAGKTTNVGGQWASTAIGMGHAEFLGPRDSVYGDWVIAFTIGRDVQYQDASLLAGLSDVEENKEKAKKTTTYQGAYGPFVKEMELSPWTSEIRGKTITAYSSKSARDAKADRDAAKGPDKDNGRDGELERAISLVEGLDTMTAQELEDYYAEMVELTAEERERFTKIDEPCPVCKALDLEQFGDIIYCISCGHVEQTLEGDVFCPFCHTELDPLKETCPSCSFDANMWQESGVFACEMHGNPFFALADQTNMEYIYACPQCLAETGESLSDFMGRRGNHENRTSLY
jgi:hypothetical protein